MHHRTTEFVMKSFTRIGLPIFIVVAAVFGITFVRVYSPDDPGSNDKPKTKTKAAAKVTPLKVDLTKATPVSATPEDWQRSLIHWDPETEVGVPGHFEFWAQNVNADPVIVHLLGVSCKCAGVEMAPVPVEAYKEYAVGSVLAAGPLCAGPSLLAIAAHANLDSRLTWSVMQEGGGEKNQHTVPGADPAAGPQVVIFRLNWRGREEAGVNSIKAGIAATLGDAPPQPITLEATTMVVPAFEAIHREGQNTWAPAPDLSVGDLQENGEARQVLYLLSTTRRELLYRVSTDRPDPCITWTEPIRASDEEVRAISDFFNQPKRPLVRIKSVYKFEVTVRERTETDAGGKKQFHQLALGLTDRRLTVSAIEGGNKVLALRARVQGDFNFLAGAPDGRVDLGNSFPSDQDRTKDVDILAERRELDLSLLTAETTPSYLKVRLDPLEKIDGRNHWRLRVMVPKGQLVGPLPPDSAVILTTNGPNPRRLRIPVRGMSYDAGNPRPRI
jgi:hypothetical protein